MSIVQHLSPIGIRRSAASAAGSIVVDGTALDTGHRERGLGRLVSGLLSGFAELSAEHRLDLPLATLRLRSSARERADGQSVAGRAGDLSVLESWTLARPRGHLTRWFLNELLLPSELEGCRLYHATDPWALPISTHFATVATVADVIPLLFPEHYLNRKHMNWRIYYAALRRADRWNKCTHIIAISQAAKATISEYLGVPGEKITVVYPGIDHGQFRTPAAETIARVRDRYGLERPFFLYLGGYDYRKNIATLIRAFANMRRSDVELVLAGGMTPRQRVDLEGVARRAAAPVRFLGYVDDDAVPALYALAVAFCYPSLAEGFGLQVLESMAMGCPVVAANSSCLPEVVGDAGLLADVHDADDFASALRRILDDSTLRQDLVARGREHVKQFSWRRCAEETLAIYRTFRAS